jgi:hypothetical protein
MHGIHERVEVERLPDGQRVTTSSQGGVAAALFAAIGSIASAVSF